MTISSSCGLCVKFKKLILSTVNLKNLMGNDMKSKILIFVNTLLVLLYAYVNSFSEIEGFNAILLIVVFGLAMAAQLIFATILKPEKINILFVTIVLLRLAVFLTIPLQKNIYLYAISVIVTFCLDLWQYLHWKTNSIFKTKTYTQDELVYSKKSIEIVFVFSLIIAALLCHNEGLAIVFLVISLYKLFKMKNSGYRVCMIIECCVSAIFIILKRLNIINNVPLYILALLVFISFVVIFILTHRKSKE